jgi:hypothetical protein
MVLSPNQTTTTSIVLFISWGDGSSSTHQGSTNLGGISLPMTINPAIQHTYSTYGTYLVTIQYSINNASQGTLSYYYNYNCGGANTSNVSASAIVECNGVTTEIVDSIPITITYTENGIPISYSSIINNGSVALPLPIAGTVNPYYTFSIDGAWLQNNN